METETSMNPYHDYDAPATAYDDYNLRTLDEVIEEQELILDTIESERV
jgi:hypothetical protein